MHGVAGRRRRERHDAHRVWFEIDKLDRDVRDRRRDVLGDIATFGDGGRRRDGPASGSKPLDLGMPRRLAVGELDRSDRVSVERTRVPAATACLVEGEW